ncbi:hypothetical protein Cgig2_024548 [Carnegiea gigantea]|uniref:Uncharacterized protein n=1 Tax=Carnegiea gigantea TaxID=171969 RepID=A0A9Q1JTI1_9CARY|nr:hypothetical protein Cgig2_024548 [Carnegiea gigantea]
MREQENPWTRRKSKDNRIEFFRDAKARVDESGIEFPKLTNFREDIRTKCIPIYMYDLKKPTDNQKHVESLDKISPYIAQPLSQIVAVETKQNVRIVTSVEVLIDSQANILADILIVSPACSLVKTMACRPLTRSISNSPTKPTPSSQPRPCESPPQPKLTSQQKSSKSPAKPTSASPPKPTAKASPPVQLKQKGKSSYYLPFNPSPSPYAKPDGRKPSDEYIQVSSYPSRRHIKSSLNKPDCSPLQSTPNPSKHDSNPKHS